MKRKCIPFAINGTEDHLHILSDIHSTVAVADLVKTIKTSTTGMIKAQGLIAGFEGWQEGYGHFTYSNDSKETLMNYINNQEEHHRKYSSKEEMVRLLKRHGIEYDPKYLE